MVRLFIGIQLFDNPFLTSFQESFKKKLQANHIKWVAPFNFHITLKFLGDTEAYYINALELLLISIANNHSGFNLEYANIGYFGTEQQPRVIYLGIAENNELFELQKDINTELLKLGFKEDKGIFKPHITLARIRKTAKPANIASIIANDSNDQNLKFSVNRIQLIKSTLSQNEPEYSILKEAVLNNAR